MYGQLFSTVPQPPSLGSLNMTLLFLNVQLSLSVIGVVCVLAISKISSASSNFAAQIPCMKTYRKQDHYTTLPGASSGCYLRRLLLIGTMCCQHCRDYWFTGTQSWVITFKRCLNLYILPSFSFVLLFCHSLAEVCRRS